MNGHASCWGVPRPSGDLKATDRAFGGGRPNLSERHDTSSVVALAEARLKDPSPGPGLLRGAPWLHLVTASVTPLRPRERVRRSSPTRRGL
jgi:hypothetical protein